MGPSCPSGLAHESLRHASEPQHHPRELETTAPRLDKETGTKAPSHTTSQPQPLPAAHALGSHQCGAVRDSGSLWGDGA